ncbi:hypothetical protein DTO002I6_8167 [Penicillium roqueforti]|nr:hypothetical protein DTO002I6_8167 [Penicillium roqueforti]
MPPPLQPTELIYCIAPVYFQEKEKARMFTSRIEDIRQQCTSARVTALCRLFVLSFGHQNIEPRTSHQSAPGATAQATTYTPFLVLSLQTTQHTLGEEGTGPITVSFGYEQPIATRETSLWVVLVADRRYDQGAAVRRVLHRVLRLDLTTSTPRTAECGSSRAFGSRKLPGAPSAPSSKRQPESATNWIQHHVNMA